GRARQEGGARGVGCRGRGRGLLQVRRRGGAGLRSFPGARHRGEAGPQRGRRRAAHAGDLPPRWLGGRHRAALARDRLRRRPAPRRGGCATARRPAGRRVIARAAVYVSTAEDILTAQTAVAHRPLGFRAIVAAVRAGARAVYVPATFRDTAIGAAVAASPRARDAVVWLKGGDLPEPGPLILLPAAVLIPVDVLRPLVGGTPGAAVAAPGGTDAPALTVDASMAKALGGALAAGTPLGGEIARLGLQPAIDTRGVVARDAAGRAEA